MHPNQATNAKIPKTIRPARMASFVLGEAFLSRRMTPKSAVGADGLSVRTAESE